MRNFKTAFLMAIFLLASAGCTHLAPSFLVKNEPVCQGVDWWEAGRTEGVAGVPLKSALKESEACEGKIDLDAFSNGHEAGLVDFCTPSQGLALGRNGQPYLHTCPSFLEGPFLQSYETGLRLRSMESQVRVDTSSKTL